MPRIYRQNFDISCSEATNLQRVTDVSLLNEQPIDCISDEQQQSATATASVVKNICRPISSTVTNAN